MGKGRQHHLKLNNMDQYNFEWYKSSNGPGLSLTIKGIAGAFLPILKNLFGIQLGSEELNSVIDAGVFLVFSGVALWGYIRSKKILGARLAASACQHGK